MSNPNPIKSCGKCAIRREQGGLCEVFHKPVDATEQGCPLFTTEVLTCDVCGKRIVQTSNQVIQTGEAEPVLLCIDCATGACNVCIHEQKCRFQTDQSCPEPPFVIQTIQKGPAVIQQQVPNIKRIKITCPDCPCYSPDSDTFCLKQQNIKCVNHKFPFEEVKN